MTTTSAHFLAKLTGSDASNVLEALNREDAIEYHIAEDGSVELFTRDRK